MRIRVIRMLGVALLFPLASIMAGCGYHFQDSSNPLKEREGISSIYIATVVNNSFKPGVETMIYNALRRKFAAGRKLALADSPQGADAVLYAIVNQAEYYPGGGAISMGTGKNASAVYSASLSCSFSLERVNPPPGKQKRVWGVTLGPGKGFPGGNAAFARGNTSHLINESEFERALEELADSMMDDLHEGLLHVF